MIRAALMSATLAAMMIAPVNAETTSDTTAAEVALRVDVAGRQRMLSQRMAKAACLAARDVRHDEALAEMQAAFDLFARSHAALRDGDAEIGLGPETYPEVIEALEEVDSPWSVVRMIVEMSIYEGRTYDDALLLLDRAAQEMTSKMNDAVGVTARAHAENAAEVPLALALTIDVAGRQRMLSQRIAKAACLLGTKAADETHRDQLAEATALFDASLTALRQGMPEAGVIAPPTREIAERLAWIAQLWAGLRADAEQAIMGEDLGDEALGQLAQRSEILLAEMNATVALYGR